MKVMPEGKEERKRRDSRRAMTPRGLFTFLFPPIQTGGSACGYWLGFGDKAETFGDRLSTDQSLTREKGNRAVSIPTWGRGWVSALSERVIRGVLQCQPLDKVFPIKQDVALAHLGQGLQPPPMRCLPSFPTICLSESRCRLSCVE